MISALTSLTRLGRAGFVFAREGVFGVIDPVAIPPSLRPLIRMVRVIERPSSGAAEMRLSTALTRLGPSYVKLGQFLATRPDVVGGALASDLERLQDQMPPFSQAQAEATRAAARREGEQTLIRARAEASNEAAALAAQYSGQVQQIVEQAHQTVSGELQSAKANEEKIVSELAAMLVDRAISEAV